MKDEAHPPIPLRPADEVMAPARLGRMFPTRLSFLRVLMRRMARDGTPPLRALWEMDPEGYGRAVYTLTLCGHRYSLVAFSQPLDDTARSDRVIATAWDAAFVLYDGVPDAGELDRLAQVAPRQEAGRFTERDLVLSRANKSVRLWSHVTERLRAGEQPDAAMIDRIGYLMRTTAVYGNGKYGIADRSLYAGRPGLELSFMAEMLTVWLIRHFTHDLAGHVGGSPLDPALRRQLGIGNATGLGMAPFLVTHPVLLSNWMAAREVALARVRAVPRLDGARRAALRGLHAQAAAHLAGWEVPDPEAQAEIVALRRDWDGFAGAFDGLEGTAPLDRLWRAGQERSVALQELLLSVMLEPFGDLVDDLVAGSTAPEGCPPPDFADTGELRAAVEADFGWALGVEYADPDACRQFWYVSEEKLEPRLGDRFVEPGAERESPLDIGRRVAALHGDLPGTVRPLPEFLAAHPEHLMAVERVALAARHPYSEIRGNLIGAACRPIDLLRAKLSLFGATRFDPKSTRWTRVTLAQGMPLAEDLESGTVRENLFGDVSPSGAR